MKKTKLVVEQGFHDTKKYTVVKLHDRLLPEIGQVLKREELDKLMKESEGLEVQVIPSKKKR